MTQQGKIERKKLTITSVEPVKKVGSKQVDKLTFKAKDGDKELTYQTFRTSLFEIIQVGQTIEFEVETSERDVDGNIFVDRKINQAFVNGEPVVKQNKGFGRSTSPEERASIETQTAVKMAVELRIADKIGADNLVFQKAMLWIDSRIPSKPEAIHNVSVKSESDKAFDKLESAGKKVWPHLENLGQLRTRMQAEGVKDINMMAAAGVDDIKKITDFDGVWANYMKAKEIK
jgi:hypothetical protein